jgi:hypothetical protein
MQESTLSGTAAVSVSEAAVPVGALCSVPAVVCAPDSVCCAIEPVSAGAGVAAPVVVAGALSVTAGAVVSDPAGASVAGACARAAPATRTLRAAAETKRFIIEMFLAM